MILRKTTMIMRKMMMMTTMSYMGVKAEARKCKFYFKTNKKTNFKAAKSILMIELRNYSSIQSTCIITQYDNYTAHIIIIHIYTV